MYIQLKKYLLCRYLKKYWNERRSLDIEDYSELKIVQRQIIDCLAISKVIKIHSDSTKNHNNIPIETEISNKEDISERAKRERRRKMRMSMEAIGIVIDNNTNEIGRENLPDEEHIPHITESKTSQEKAKDLTNSSFKAISAYNEAPKSDQSSDKPLQSEIRKYLFKESAPVSTPVIDRIVLLAQRSLFNTERIPLLPKQGPYSVMVNGEYMLINIDYEAIIPNVPCIKSITPVLYDLLIKNHFNNFISTDTRRAIKEHGVEKTFRKLIESGSIKLWGIEIAFDFFNISAEKLINTSFFRKYSSNITGLPTYYSKDSKKNSLIILYDRKEKLRKQGVILPYTHITRFEIKYYHTYMRSKTFRFDLIGWLNKAPLILAIENRIQITKAMAHVFKRINPFKKMQDYIAAIDAMNFLKWLLAYTFPVI